MLAMRRRISGILGTSLIVFGALAVHSRQALARDFYQGKQITLVVASDPGGGYDAYARLLAMRLSEHIPGNPNIVIENMPGAGGLKAMNYIATVAPKDGTYLGAMQNGIAYEPMMGISGGKGNSHFDPLKVNWVGSMGKEVAVTALWNPATAHDFEDLKHKAVTVGSSGESTSNSTYPRLMNAMFGTKFKIIEGYTNQAPIWLAMERGEVQGSGGPFYSSLVNSKPDWIRDHKVTLIVQIGLEKDPHLPNVPLLYDLAKTSADRQELRLAFGGLLMGRPYVLPQGVPADRVKILRDAFMATMKDPALLRQADRMRLEINPMTGEEVHQLVVGMYSTPQPIVDKVAAIFAPNSK
jgi:tripartite-type tricarboxylate transporter receptor subunit TctC